MTRRYLIPLLLCSGCFAHSSPIGRVELKAKDVSYESKGEKKAIAKGDITLTYHINKDEKVILKADQVTAFLKDKGQFHKVMAKGHVFIQKITGSLQESLQCESCHYDIVNGLIECDSSFIFKRANDTLKGESAVINLKTGHYKVTNGHIDFSPDDLKKK
jgi:lipopolysaccharide export system protein LptA